IHGDVFTKDERGPSVVPGTRLVLRGPVTKETESNVNGAYAFDALPPGNYTIEAHAPGLSVTLKVDVRDGGVSVTPIELAVEALTSSVTVTANDPGPVVEAAQINTIKPSTID